MSEYPVVEKNKIRQAPMRARYDKAFVHAVLDEGYVAHASFVDEGSPMIIPLYYVRIGDELILHGSRKARVMRVLATGIEVSLAVTHLDALVLARSAFHHSMNYRSVIIHGKARQLEGKERALALDALINRFEAGRADETRRMNKSEDKATLVLAVPFDEISAKARTGPPVDDEEDMVLPVKAGIVPLKVEQGDFEPG